MKDKIVFKTKSLNFISQRKSLWLINKKIYKVFPSVYSLLFKNLLKKNSWSIDLSLKKVKSFFKSFFTTIRLTLSLQVQKEIVTYYKSFFIYKNKLKLYTTLCTTFITLLQNMINEFIEELENKGAKCSLEFFDKLYNSLLSLDGKFRPMVNNLQLLHLKSQVKNKKLRSALDISQKSFVHLLNVGTDTSSHIYHLIEQNYVKSKEKTTTL